jgi:hypothetical protein
MQLEKVEVLEGQLLLLPQVDCPVTHRFGPGLYMREISIPKDSIVIGHYQNFEQVNILLQGKLTLFGENGERKEVVAPATFVGQPGRKIAYAHEDSKFMNVYSTHETDVEKLEANLVTKTSAWLTNSEEKHIASLKNGGVECHS